MKEVSCTVNKCIPGTRYMKCGEPQVFVVAGGGVVSKIFVVPPAKLVHEVDSAFPILPH